MSNGTYRHDESTAKLIADWFSRFTATFCAVLLALIVWSLLVRFYVEMTIGQAIGELTKPEVVKPMPVKKWK